MSKERNGGNMVYHPYLVAAGTSLIAISVFIARRTFKLQDQDVYIVLLATLPWLLLLLPRTMKWIGIKEIEVFGVKVQAMEHRLEMQEAGLALQQKIVNEIVVFGTAYYLVDMLRKFVELKASQEGDYKFDKSDESMARSLYFLRDHGLIGQIAIRSLVHGENILPKIIITPAGSLFLKLRDDYEAKHKLAAESEGH